MTDAALGYENATPTEKRIDTAAFILMFVPLVCLSTWYVYKAWGWYAPLTGLHFPTLTYSNMFCLLMLKNLIFVSPSLAKPQKQFLMPQVLQAVISSTIHFIASWVVYRLAFA